MVFLSSHQPPGLSASTSDKRSLPTQDRTRDFAVSCQTLNSLLEYIRASDAIATKATFTMGTYQIIQAGYLT